MCTRGAGVLADFLTFAPLEMAASRAGTATCCTSTPHAPCYLIPTRIGRGAALENGLESLKRVRGSTFDVRTDSELGRRELEEKDARVPSVLFLGGIAPVVPAQHSVRLPEAFFFGDSKTFAERLVEVE